MILLEVIIVILAALAAWFYPVYGAARPAHVEMADREAQLLAVYLLVIGALFIVSRRRRKPPRPAPPPAPKSTVPPAKP